MKTILIVENRYSITELVQRCAEPEATLIFDIVIDDSMGDGIQITVIATGFEKEEEKRQTQVLTSS